MFERTERLLVSGYRPKHPMAYSRMATQRGYWSNTFPLGDTAKTRNHTRAGVAARCRPRHGRRVATSRSLHRVTHRAHLEQHVHLIVSLAAGAWSSCQSVAAAMHLRGRSVVHRGRSMSRRQSGRRAAEAAFKHVPRTRLRPARSARRRLACSLPIRSSTT